MKHSSSRWQPTPPAPTTSDERTTISAWLRMAPPLDLTLTPQSENAKSLVQTLVDAIVAHEASAGTRGNKRRAKGLQTLATAIAAVIGSCLKQWAKETPRASRQTVKAAEFSGRPVGYRTFVEVRDALCAMDHIIWLDGARFALNLDWGDGITSHSKGYSARLWPGKRLLKAAEANGVTPATIKTDFASTSVPKPPKVTQALEVRHFQTKQHGPRSPQSRPQLIPLSAAAFKRLHADVIEANDFAARFDVLGCAPPRWRRVFNGCGELGGRWIVAGKDRPYQNLPPRDRAAVTIDGADVVEVDVSGAHLTIMLGLLGRNEVADDLYDLDDVPRRVTKLWVLGCLGKGTPHLKRWAPPALRDNPLLAAYKPAEVAAVMMARYPFLAAPADAVAAPAGLSRLSRFGPPDVLLTHRLMNIEATCLTTAMQVLRHRGVLALPVHDSLIVARQFEGEAMTALREAFKAGAGIVPRVKVSAL